MSDVRFCGCFTEKTGVGARKERTFPEFPQQFPGVTSPAALFSDPARTPHAVRLGIDEGMFSIWLCELVHKCVKELLFLLLLSPLFKKAARSH